MGLIETDYLGTNERRWPVLLGLLEVKFLTTSSTVAPSLNDIRFSFDLPLGIKRLSLPPPVLGVLKVKGGVSNSLVSFETI